jgi:hypothetical protein
MSELVFQGADTACGSGWSGASDHGDDGLGLTRRIRRAHSGRFPVSRRSGSAPNWIFCMLSPGELGIHRAAHTRQGVISAVSRASLSR